MRGTTSLLRKTTMELRIGTTGHLRYGIVQKLTFARFLASFDFRLFQHYRPGAEVAAGQPVLGTAYSRNLMMRGQHSPAGRTETWRRGVGLPSPTAGHHGLP